MNRRHSPARQAGYLMIEVLITMFILVVGLLGLAGLQSRAQQAETESYQRVQALVLLRDMADRINANRSPPANLAIYAAVGTTNPLGTGHTGASPCAAPVTQADHDLCQWHLALLGAAETLGGSDVGAMTGARGCITSPGANQYLIEVSWQGFVQTTNPLATLICGKDSYGAEAAAATMGRRRDAATLVTIGILDP